MREIAFTIMGEPKHQERHRDRKPVFKGGHGYTPKYDPSAKDKETFLALSRQYAPEKPIETPVKLLVICYFSRLKSHYRTGKFSKELRPDAPKIHTSKPDFDNLAKLAADSLTGIFWIDDSVIYDGRAVKFYDEYARTEVHIIY